MKREASKTLQIFIRYWMLVCFLASAAIASAQKNRVLRGVVTDISNAPIAFANIKIKETGSTAATDTKGRFHISVPAHAFESITVEVSFVNKQTMYRLIQEKDLTKSQQFTMIEQSLALPDVEIQATRQQSHSVSSIIFDSEAIRQSQAFSLADILNKLPGKTTNAPTLQTPQTLTLRTSAEGLNAMNNSFGIAIYIDGTRISNDANMQGRNLSIWGMQRANISSHTDGGNSYDVVYNGFDLRDIPIERIERIEVIQGIADARYGELTNGAILITTRAGKTPVNLALNMNGGSMQVTGSKGFLLGGKAGAVNISAGITSSNADPRNNIKSYKRVNSSLQWTVDIARNVKSTVSVGYDRKLDDVMQDPDDDAQKATYQKGYSFNVSERIRWNIDNGWIDAVSASMNFSRGRQETYNQWLLNQPPSGVADKDTTGVYEGYYIPGNYLAVEHIVGIPLSVNGNLDVNTKPMFTGKLMHRLSFGASIAQSGNRGPGIIVDPTKPRWGSQGYKTERPINFDKTIPLLTNHGYYIQDNISGKIFERNFTATLGFRTDIQNGFAAFQPRLSVSVPIDKHFGMTLAYGISTKAPSLAERYPSPSWLDIPVLDLYTGNANQSLFLVYTKKIINDNSSLRAARSQSLELGLNYRSAFAKGSLIGFIRKNTNGFNSYSNYEPVWVPKYGYTINPQTQKIDYFPTGDSILYSAVSRYVITNGLYTGDMGAELMFSTKVIKPIATSFSLRSSFTYSEYDARNDREIIAVSETFLQQGKPALYGVYRPKSNSSYSMVSTISSITHIPKIGFVITVSGDVTMMKTTRNNPRSNDPIGYIDRMLQYVEIDASKVANAEYDYLRQKASAELTTSLPFMYASVNVTIAKEIRKKMRLMLTGYNLFNIQPEYYKRDTRTLLIYNSPVSLSAGLTIQL